MSAEDQDIKTTDESQFSGGLNAAAAGSAAGGLNASASRKSTQEKRKAPKLAPKKESQPSGETHVNGNAEANRIESAPQAPETKMENPKSQVRRQSRGRGRSQGPASDTESVARSDVSAQGGRRNRNKNRGKQQAQAQAQAQQNSVGGGRGPLGVVDELGETAGGATRGAQDLVQNTVGGAVGQATDTVSKTGQALGDLVPAGKKEGEGGESGGDEQLRLRLDLNLDIEIQLKAKIHGDLTLGLLN